MVDVFSPAERAALYRVITRQVSIFAFASAIDANLCSLRHSPPQPAV